jgi:hypothetical protein
VLGGAEVLRLGGRRLPGGLGCEFAHIAVRSSHVDPERLPRTPPDGVVHLCGLQDLFDALFDGDVFNRQANPAHLDFGIHHECLDRNHQR